MKKDFNTILSKLSNAGLLLLVFLLPIQTRWIAGQGMIGGNPNEFLTVSLYGVDILVVLLVFLKIYLKFEIRIRQLADKSETTSNIKNSKYKTLVNLSLLFIFWNILSILWAANKILAMQHVFWLLLAVGIAWLVATCKNKIILMHTVLVGLTFSAWMGIWQFIFQSTFANKWLGLALHDPRFGGTSIVEIYSANGSPIRWLRAYSFFDHPNIFGMAMTVGILLVFTNILRHSERSVAKSKNPELNTTSHNLRGFLTTFGMTGVKYVALISMAAGLFVSLSRSAWLGLVLGIFVIVLLKFFKSTANAALARIRHSFQRRVLVFSTTLIMTTFAILAAIYPAQFLMRSGGVGRLEEKSLNDRAVFLQQGKVIIKNNALFGVGAGNYIEISQKNNPGSPAWTYQPVHNVFLLVWAELGIIGMLMLITLPLIVLQSMWFNKNIAGTALIISLTPTLLLDHWLWSLHFGILFVGLIIGIMLCKLESTSD